MLVVIGIIAVLISILLPALQKARRQAQIVACASNERQIVQMMAIYASQFQGWLPPIDKVGATFITKPQADATPNWWNGWDQILLETVMHGGKYGNTNTNANLAARVWHCPADEMPRQASTANYIPRSYAINCSKWTYGLDDSMGADSKTGQHPFEGYKAPWSAGCRYNGAQVSFGDGQYVQQAKFGAVPGHIWLLGENWGQSTVYSTSDSPNITSNKNQIGNDSVVGTWSYATMDTSPARFHGTSWGGANQARDNGGNYAYADGHVEFIRLMDLAVPSPASSLQDGFSHGVASNGADGCPTNKYNGMRYSVMEDHWKWKAK